MHFMVSEVLMFHENTYLLPYGDFYNLSLSNIDPDERITLVLFGIRDTNQLFWVEVSKEDRERGTNILGGGGGT